MPLPTLPRIEVYPHTDCDGIALSWLTGKIQEALPACLAAKGAEMSEFPGLENIEVSLISDSEIARIHEQFMDDPTATDVITFHHGEILVSVDTARREAPSHDNTFSEEILLYIIHGILHLNGHTDLSEPERSNMVAAQEKILKQVTTPTT